MQPSKEKRMTADESTGAWLAEEERDHRAPGCRPRPRRGAARAGRRQDRPGNDAGDAARRDCPTPPIAKTLDFQLHRGRRRAAPCSRARRCAQHLNPMGGIHGGWFATLLDSALGCAVHTMMPAGRGYTTAELGVNLVKALDAQGAARARRRQGDPLRPAARHRRGAAGRRRRHAVRARHDDLPGVRDSATRRRLGPRACRSKGRLRRLLQ